MIFKSKFCTGLVLAAVAVCAHVAEAAIDREFLRDLLAIPSVTADIPAVNRAMDATRAYLERTGIPCRVETDEAGHRILWASTDGEKTADYVLAVHLDVVPAEAAQFQVRVEGDRIFARGAHDCKGNALIACDVLRRLKGKASVGVIFAANEELGGSTTRVMVERGYRPRRMALVVDAGAWGVYYAQKGNCYITVRAKGKGGHSSCALWLDNPIERLTRGYEAFRASWPAVPKDGWGDLVVPTVIGAGQAENAIPDTAEMVLNVRSVSYDAPERVIARLKQIKGFEVVKVRSTGRPMASDPNHPEIQRLLAERRARWPKQKGELARMLAITDARHFADLKLPVVIIGSLGGNAHGRGEWGDMKNMDENADSLVAFLSAPPAGGTVSAASNDRLRERATVTADFTRRVGPVKPMHGVGQPPQIGWDYRLFHYLKDAGIPYSRLHDVGGFHGKDAYVDIPNIFRDFDADENDPKSYDFAFTDHLLKHLVANNVEPFYRLGITIENRVDIKPYRTFPPKDPAKWARICEHVIRHYTEGWANGFKYRITYWEIWNEPENELDKVGNSAMWHGSWNQYLDLYEVTSKHLKTCFPHLKIGGYAGCGFYGAGAKPGEIRAKPKSPEALYVNCFHQFLQRVKEKKCPLDFYSFHTYSNPKEALRQIEWGLASLHAQGFTNVETIVDEWLPHVGHENLGTALQASAICAEMIGMQQAGLDAAMIYDGRCGIGNYSPLFNPMTYKPHKAYYALKAFNEVYKLKHMVRTETSHPSVYALAAGDAAGGVLLVANTAKDAVPFRPELGGLRMRTCRLTDADHTDEEGTVPDHLPPRSFLLIRVGRD